MLKCSHIGCRILDKFDIDTYFDEFDLKFTETLANEKVLLGVHPHNVLTFGLGLHHYKGRFGKMYILASRMLT